MKHSTFNFTKEDFEGGTVERIIELIKRNCGLTMSLVFPRSDGWGQLDLGTAGPNENFCKIIMSSKAGAKHCKMCHVLMTVAACSQGMTEQQCHAGATVLVYPIDEGGEEGVALLSSCAFKHEDKKKLWNTVGQRAKQLGLDPAEVKKAFEELPDINDERVHCLHELVPVLASAIKEHRERMFLLQEIETIRNSKGRLTGGDLLKREFEETAVRQDAETAQEGIKAIRGKKTPALIQVVCSLVSRRPQTSYTVEELAAAARMTPNYFSSMFHKHTGQCFMDYLTDRRIELAQKLLLSDPSSNISEVASMCGYDDPGYFTRRFKKKTGMTPRMWRENRG